jgi:hypothetical protein
MTLLEKINNLTWFSEIIKLKEILKGLLIPIDSRTYKVYTALLTQVGTDNPTVDILENTLGYDLVWARTSGGIYQTQILSNPKNKVWYSVKTAPSEAKEITISFTIANKLLIQTYSIISGLVTTGDNRLASTPIEIRIYN